MKHVPLAVVVGLLLASPAQPQGTGIVQASGSAAIKSIRQVSITVSDIDATVAFYSKAVPYPVERRFTVQGSAFPRELLNMAHRRVEVALIKMPTGTIQLMDFEPGKPAAPNPRPVIGPGYTHICFQSSAHDPAIKRFKAAGLNIISRFGKEDGVDIGGYGVRYAYGRDPDGIMIENESLDAPKRSEPAWITHIANTVHDRDAMLTFYEKLFGKKPQRTIEQDGHPRLADVVNMENIAIKGGWFSLGNMDLEVWEYVRPKTPVPSGSRKLDEIGYTGFGLEVSDLKSESMRIKRLGISMVGNPVSLGDWRMQFGVDPEGNLFSLDTLKAGGRR